MDFPKIHESEYRFCLIMWEYEPVTVETLKQYIESQRSEEHQAKRGSKFQKKNLLE